MKQMFPKDINFFLIISLGTKVMFQQHPEQDFTIMHDLFWKSVILEKEISGFSWQEKKKSWMDTSATKTGQLRSGFPFIFVLVEWNKDTSLPHSFKKYLILQLHTHLYSVIGKKQ